MGNRNCTIDLVKTGYCLIIVGLHSVYLMSDGIRHIFPHGYLAVEFFFIVSGYLMANTAFKKELSVEVYMLRKYRSLLPYIIFAWISGAMIIFFAHPEISFPTHMHNFINSIWQILMLDLAGFNGYQVIGSFWYLSAMFLTMPIVYCCIKRIPFFTSGGDLWISIFIYGWFAKNYGLIITASGAMYEVTGLLRALAGLSLGCFCYRMACKLSRYLFTKRAKIVFTMLELGGYLLSVMIICRPWTGKGDVGTFFIILTWLISVTITFSQVSYSAKLNNKFVERYAKNIAMFSTALYLCHGRMQSFVVNFIPSLSSFEERIVPYYILSILLSILCVMFVKSFNSFFGKHQLTSWIFVKRE